MSFKFIGYALWCVMLFASTASCSYYAWSPFADAKRDARSAGLYGPSHK